MILPFCINLPRNDKRQRKLNQNKIKLYRNVNALGNLPENIQDLYLGHNMQLRLISLVRLSSYVSHDPQFY